MKVTPLEVCYSQGTGLGLLSRKSEWDSLFTKHSPGCWFPRTLSFPTSYCCFPSNYLMVLLLKKKKKFFCLTSQQKLLVIHLRCLCNIFNLHFYVYIMKQRCCQKHHRLRGTQIICEARALFFVWNVISMTNNSDSVVRKLPLKSLWFCHGNSCDKIMAFIVLPLIHICKVDFFFQSWQCRVQKMQWGTTQYMSSPRQHQELRLYFKDKHTEAVVKDLW